MNEWEKMWADQADFNEKFRQRPKDFKEKSQQTRDMVLELTDEAHGLLRTMDHKHHRRTKVLPNVAHTEEKLADMFKYFITLCQIHDVTPERLQDLYWHKSMVCRQRYSEEWVKAIDRPCVIWDLDQVLCDYAQGVIDWLSDKHVMIDPGRRTLALQRGWVDAEILGVDLTMWASIKHYIRTSRAKETFPVMPNALTVFNWAKAKGWLNIVLTARPIDRYPNLYSTTLAWLQANKFFPDFVWWADNKPERIGDLHKHVVFAVDDMYGNIDNYFKSGIKTYWFTQLDPHIFGGGSLDPAFTKATTVVRSLSEIPEHYERFTAHA